MPRCHGVRVRQGLHTSGERESQATHVVDGTADECTSFGDDSCSAPPIREPIRARRSLRPPTVRWSASLKATASRTIDSRYRRRHSLGSNVAATAHRHRSQHVRPRVAVHPTTATLKGHDPISVGSSVSNVMAIFGSSLHSFPSSATSRRPSAGTIDAAATSDHHGLLPTSLTFIVRAVSGRADGHLGRAKRRSGDRCVHDTAGPSDGPAPQQEDVRPWASRCRGGKV